MQKTDPRYTNGHHPYDGAYDREGQPQRREVKNNKGEGKRRTVLIVEPDQRRDRRTREGRRERGQRRSIDSRRRY